MTEFAARGLDPKDVPIDRRIAAVADRQCEIVTREQLLALGLRRGAIDWRIQRGLLYRMHRGVYMWGHPSPSPIARAVGAVLACGLGSVLSHFTAAALWEIRAHCAGLIEVTVVGRRVRLPGIATRVTRSLGGDDIRTLHGIPITSPARTLLDLASRLPTRELAATVEQAQIKGIVTEQDLTATLARAPDRGGAPALRALLLGRPFTRSTAERRLVALLRAAKLRAPAFNRTIATFEVDAVWLVERVVLEFDSYAFHATRAAFERDRHRDATLTRAGYVVLRTTWRELDDEPYALIARIAEALSLAGDRDRRA